MNEVVVVAYDPAWPALFERLRAPIAEALGDAATTIEHVGSTAVPGLAAKPIIDMTIVVPHEAALRSAIDRLATLGYRHRGDLGVPGREAFARPIDSPEHHLYACIEGTQSLRNHRTVRDHLRRNPEVAAKYGAIKRELARRFSHDLDAYIDGKTQFILNILAESGFVDDELRQIEVINRDPKRPT